MKLEQTLLKLCPKSLRLPVNYHYRKVRKRLEKETLYLDSLVGNRKRAIDIGANEGIYSYALSKICDIVEAFEPQSWCTEAIKAYSQAYSGNINVYNVGLSNFHGSLTLHIPTSSGDYSRLVSGLGKLTTGLGSFREIEGEQMCIDVPVCKLDDYEFKDVSFMKIDVEGHESKVIEGGLNTILREKPIILIEIEQRHLEGKPINKLFEQIAELGYEGSFLYKGSLTPLSKFCSEINQNQFVNDVFHEDYINNFIFKPVSKYI